MSFPDDDFWNPAKKKGASAPRGRGARPPRVTSDDPVGKGNADSRFRQASAANASDDSDDELEEVVRGAPPWLMSMAAHLMILMFLGLIGAAQLLRPATNEITAKIDPNDVAPPDVFAEEIGVQLKDPNSTAEGDPSNGDQVIITPQDPSLPIVPDPFAAPPNIADLTPGGSTVTSAIDAPEIGLALSGRTPGRTKNILLGKYGGNKTTEEAVQLGLAWLAKNQLKESGNWSLTRPYGNGADAENLMAATGLALIAFQGAGNTHRSGDFQKNVSRGMDWLLKNEDKDGNFFQAGESHQRLYSQAICTIALCELFGMTHDSHLREPAERAVKYAVRVQAKEGGWRYAPGEDSDLSVTGWFVIALQSAKMAGLEVPADTLDRISAFIDRCALGDGKEYGYQADRRTVSKALTAEGLLCREYLGWKQNDPRLKEGLTALLQTPVNYTGQGNVYYWYYAAQATHHLEGEVWDKWNAVMRQEVPSHQVKNGPEAGSWSPIGDEWGGSGGRLYTTCLSIYMLEVYYRHLPIYSGYKLYKPKAGATPEAD